VAKGEKWAVNKWVRERRIRLDYEREADPDAVRRGAPSVPPLLIRNG
jgi:hypothetical protein